MVSANDHFQFVTASDESGQNCSRLVGHGKKLAGVFALEVDAQRGEPVDRSLHRKGGEDILDDVAIAEEVGGGHDIVRDIAATASGDEDLRSDGLGAIEKDDLQWVTGPRCPFPCEDTSSQARSPGSDNTHINY
jgi:hypothetical protein